MNEDQKKWLLYLQEKGIVIECRVNSPEEFEKAAKFEVDTNRYQFPTQPIPDIPGWRELCWDMQSKGVRFEMLWGSMWNEDRHDFEKERDRYRIPQQSLPEWREEMTEETKPEPREEIPHLEQQIQWHEDMLHHLRTGEPMPVWEYRLKNGDGEWKICHDPHFSEKYEYRRKPRTVTYWHCVGVYIGYQDNGVVDREVFSSDCSASDVQSQIDTCKENYPSARFSQITETTVELED